jgi:hypothetical protein
MRLGSSVALLCALVVTVAPTALADWGHPVVWDQLDPVSSHTGFSYVGSNITADDFQCSETGWITDIEFCGDPNHMLSAPDTIQITFWSDVRATPDDDSHPGELKKTITVNPADSSGLGWKEVEGYDPVGTERKFKINLPECDWFFQEDANIYWIGIQAEAGFSWSFRAPEQYPVQLDPAAWVTPDTGVETWQHWAWNLEGRAERCYGILPENLWPADMSFRLTGIPIPEPSLIALLAATGLALLKRRSR